MVKPPKNPPPAPPANPPANPFRAGPPNLTPLIEILEIAFEPKYPNAPPEKPETPPIAIPLKNFPSPPGINENPPPGIIPPAMPPAAEETKAVAPRPEIEAATVVATPPETPPTTAPKPNPK